MTKSFIYTNKKAHFDYQILEKYEAGIVLSGFEVRSIRSRGMVLNDSYVRINSDLEVTLLNASIPPFQGSPQKYDDRRDRKLLLHASEIRALFGKLSQGGFTVVPLKVYPKKNFIKIEIALAKNKKQYDKRDAIKKKDIKRDVEREIRGKLD